MTRKFGPFLISEEQLVEPAGFKCQRCGQKVKRAKLSVPLAVRVIFYNCRCGTVGCWEDENQPDFEIWKSNVDLLKQSGTDMLMFTGSNEIKPGFQGIQ